MPTLNSHDTVPLISVDWQALLSAPNPDDPLANDVAELWKVCSLRFGSK